MKRLELEWSWNVDNKRDTWPSSSDRGSYALLILLDKQVTINKPSKTELNQGWYAYVGSAKNGILTRLKWHLKKDKRLTWHVDQLTTQGQVVGMLWSKSLSECDFAVLLREKGGIEVVRKFGASDCKNNCFSHLFWISDSKTRQPLFNFDVGFDLTRDL